MNLNDSTVVTGSEPWQEFSDFARWAQYHLYQTAALAVDEFDLRQSQSSKARG